MYEFLHGQAPFHANTEDDIIANMMTGNLILSKQISAEARDLIARLMHEDCNKRLGHENGAQAIKAHSWFSDIKWSDFEKRHPDPLDLGEVPEQASISMSAARKRRGEQDIKEILLQAQAKPTGDESDDDDDEIFNRNFVATETPLFQPQQ